MGGLVNPVIFRAGHHSFWNYIGVNRMHDQDVKNVLVTLSERILRKREKYMRNKLFLSYWNNKVIFMADNTVLIRLNFYNSKKEVWWIWRAHLLEKGDLRYIDKCLNVLGGVMKLKMQSWLQGLSKRGEAVYNKIHLHPAVFDVRRRFYAVVRLETYQAHFRAQRILEVMQLGLYAKFVKRNYAVTSDDIRYVKGLQTTQGLYITKGLYKIKKTANRALKKRIIKRRGEVLHMVEGLYKRNRNHSFLTTFLVLGFSVSRYPTQYVKNKFLYFGECFFGLNPIYNQYYAGLAHNWVSITSFIQKSYYKFKRRDNLYSELRVDLNRILFQSYYNRKDKKRYNIESLLNFYTLKDVQFTGELAQYYQTSLKYFIKRMHSYSLLQFPKLFQVAICVNSKVKSGQIMDLQNFQIHKNKVREKYVTRFRVNLSRLLVKNILNKPLPGSFSLFKRLFNNKDIHYNVNFVQKEKLRTIYRLIQSTRIKNLIGAQNYVLSRYRSLIWAILKRDEVFSIKRRIKNKRLKKVVKLFVKRQASKKVRSLHKQKTLTKEKVLATFYPLSYKFKLIEKKKKKRMSETELKALLKKKAVYKVKNKLTRVEKLAKKMTPMSISSLPLSTQEFIKNAKLFETPDEEKSRKKEQRLYLEKQRNKRFKNLITYFVRRRAQNIYQIPHCFTSRELLFLKKNLKKFFIPNKILKTTDQLTTPLYKMFPGFFPKEIVNKYTLFFYKKLKRRHTNKVLKKILSIQWGSKDAKPLIWWPLRLKQTVLFQKKTAKLYYVCLNTRQRKKEYMLLRRKIKAIKQPHIFKLQQLKFFKVFKREWPRLVFKAWKKKKKIGQDRHMYLKKSERYRTYRVKCVKSTFKRFYLRQVQHEEMSKRYNALLLIKYKQLTSFFRNQKIDFYSQSHINLEKIVNKFIYINFLTHKMLKLCGSKMPMGVYKKTVEVQKLFAKVCRYHNTFSELNYRSYKKGKRDEKIKNINIRWFPHTVVDKAELKKQETHYKLQNILYQKQQSKLFQTYDVFILKLLKYLNKFQIERQYPLFSTFIFKLFLNKFLYRKQVWNKYVHNVHAGLLNYKKNLILNMNLNSKIDFKLNLNLGRMNLKKIKVFFSKKLDRRRVLEVVSFLQRSFYKKVKKKKLQKKLKFKVKKPKLTLEFVSFRVAARALRRAFHYKNLKIKTRLKLLKLYGSLIPEKIDHILRSNQKKAEKLKRFSYLKRQYEREKRRKRYIRQEKLTKSIETYALKSFTTENMLLSRENQLRNQLRKQRGDLKLEDSLSQKCQENYNKRSEYKRSWWEDEDKRTQERKERSQTWQENFRNQKGAKPLENTKSKKDSNEKGAIFNSSHNKQGAGYQKEQKEFKWDNHKWNPQVMFKGVEKPSNSHQSVRNHIQRAQPVPKAPKASKAMKRQKDLEEFLRNPDFTKTPRRYFVTNIKKQQSRFENKRWLKGSTGARNRKLRNFYESLWDSKPVKALNFLFKKIKKKKKINKKVNYKSQKHKSILKLINNKRDKARLIKKKFRHYYYYKLSLCVLLTNLKNILQVKRHFYYSTRTTIIKFLLLLKNDIFKRRRYFKVFKKPGKPYKTVSTKSRVDCIGLVLAL